ncbi:MAG TPA: aminotransferase class V-fold PLP-dependent enzyme, partial [Planctomycetaceae bacterium]|nr:aminotransferase class V-fold PLP-dependent enzyme [Planctomycetaceae bacterium]
GLRGIGGPVRVFGPDNLEHRVGVVSITIDGSDPQDLAAILDESFEIQTRAGLHCAPGAHKAIGTFDRGGTVRFSLGPFTTSEHVDAAIDAVREIAHSAAAR